MCVSRASAPLVKYVTQLADIQPKYESKAVALFSKFSVVSLAFRKQIWLTFSVCAQGESGLDDSLLQGRVDKSPMQRNNTAI